jgi:tetratricopeptide (TPR) repeat protein
MAGEDPTSAATSPAGPRRYFATHTNNRPMRLDPHRHITAFVAALSLVSVMAQDTDLAAARGHLEQGDVMAAAASARRSLKEKKTGEAYYIIGHAQLAMNEADSARESFEKAIDLDDQQEEAVFELGLALDDLGEHKKAIQKFRRFAELRPADPRGRVQEAYVLLSSLEDADGAKRILDSCAVRFPDNSTVLYYQAVAAKSLGRVPEAFEWLDKGTIAHPTDPDFPFQRGRWLCEADRFREGEVFLAKALELDPNARRARWWAWSRMMAATDSTLWKRVDGEIRLTAPWLNDMQAMDELIAVGARYDQTELSKRFLAGEKMGLDEMFLFYYGQSITDAYAPYGDPAEEELDALLEKAAYDKAIDWADEHVKTHPACLETWRSKAFACSKADDPCHQQATINYDLLLNAVTASGSGASMDDAMWVMCVHDEYIMVGYEGLDSGGQSLLHSGKYDFDLLECTNEKGKKVERYFNITKPFSSLGKMFKGK